MLANDDPPLLGFAAMFRPPRWSTCSLCALWAGTNCLTEPACGSSVSCKRQREFHCSARNSAFLRSEPGSSPWLREKLAYLSVSSASAAITEHSRVARGERYGAAEV